ncbi:lipid-A-disaccharide synthase [Pararhizobium haloflavum]|uniref:lipid-A-disaccharide synthase n=1 Tax=Pararhizobium haloflavum TaxID=2037914 RepID=UPI000C184523|nr:lipid-A-disaccharide synthase [Pararhizobium haloflavum]
MTRGKSDTLTVAIIAGEPSGDRLGADLISQMRMRCGGNIALVGVGGDQLIGEGLTSLFDYSELSIVGVGAVVARLPQLMARIRQTARAIIAARPDVLVIVDSPDFTHRVARRVRNALPQVPIIDYVCPTVWAWKPERAPAMAAYIDHVLSILPFEPSIVETLGGPPTTYVGHRLVFDTGLLSARAEQHQRRRTKVMTKTVMLLPGSRAGELKRMLPLFRDAAAELASRNQGLRFVLPAQPRHNEFIASHVADWPAKPELVIGEEAKWRAFAQADGALAASGTVLLELALAGVPCISAYQLDPMARLLISKITGWSAALPNLIAGYPVIPEYFNESARANRLVRHLERLIQPTIERDAMLQGFDAVRNAMAVTRTPGEHAAEIVLDFARSGRSAAVQVVD